MISAQDKEIQALVADVRDGRLLLPELQRSYVWKSTQVRDLFDSLYHQYPSGQLLIWETDDIPFAKAASVDQIETNARRPQLLLDGQQRLTSLAAIMLGRPLVVDDAKRPIDIAFNVFTEKFEVSGPRQRGESGWISLSRLFTEGEFAILQDLNLNMATAEARDIFERIKRIGNIKGYKYRVNVLEDLSYEEVTHIFVRINSGGTKLSGADLTLAQLSSRWRGVTEYLAEYQRQLTRKGLDVDTGLLLRTLAVMLSGQSRLSELFRGERQALTIEQLAAAWKRVHKGMDQAVHFLVHNCQIDRLELLPTNTILVPLTVFFDVFGAGVTTQQARELQRWVYMALIWARYSVSSETSIDQDVAVLQKNRSIQEMIQNIEDKVGRRPVTERELRDQRKNSPYMLMAYVLARYAHAQDWFNGVALGRDQALELHHIFPKKLLRERYNLRKDSLTVDQVANLVFLSGPANNRISSTAPNLYLPEIAPERLRAQHVPANPDLWTIANFEEFLLERRSLLAEAINRLLLSLNDQPSLWPTSLVEMLDVRIDAIEKTMRDLVVERLTEAFGDTAWERAVPAQLRKNVEYRTEQQLATKPFMADQFATLAGKLSLCQFSDYPKIIELQWHLFQDIFGKLETFQNYYRLVTDARNAIKHNRELSRSELAASEAGLLWLEECLKRKEVTETAEADSVTESHVEEDDKLHRPLALTREKFLEMCSPPAAKAFAAILDMSVARGHLIRWNRKSFAIRAIDPITHREKSFAYGWPQNEDFNFYFNELDLPIEQAQTLRQELLAQGVFRESGQKTLVTERLNETIAPKVVSVYQLILDRLDQFLNHKNGKAVP